MINLVWYPVLELTIITGGVIAALIVGPDRELRRFEHDQELSDIDAWLDAMWEAGDFGNYLATSRRKREREERPRNN